MKNNKFSIIIPHTNEWYMLNITLDSIHNYVKYNNFEILIVDDWSDNLEDLAFINNHPLSSKIKIFYKKWLWVANARNYGVSKASGDILFFLDSHMYFMEDSLERLNYTFNNFDYDLIQPMVTSITNKSIKWYHYIIWAQTLTNWWKVPLEILQSWVYDTPNIDGCSILIKKKVFEELDWFCKYYIKWWAEDLEMSMRAWLCGYKCWLDSNTKIAHYFKDSFKNTVINTDDTVHNKIMFVYTCFLNENRREKILNSLQNYLPNVFEDLVIKVNNNNNFLDRVTNIQNKFKYDDDWYFEKFKYFYSDLF